MSAETLVIVRGEFSIEDPWAVPQACEPVRLRRATDGTAPRLSTTLSAYFDRDYLTVVFSGADDHVLATLYERDAPIYEEDAVEVFLAPGDEREYFEVEVSPVATIFDARIVSPDGVRDTMRTDVAWNCEGIVAAVRKLIIGPNQMTIDTVIRIPFRSIGVTPDPQRPWRGNFFRIDRHPAEGDEYTAWRPTLKTPADFHVVAAFGSLVFRD